MNKFVFLLLFSLAISVISHAQKPYSQENLQNLTNEELDVFYNKALKLQKTGRTLNIVGVSSLGVTAVAAILGSDWGFGVDSWSLILIAGGGIIVGGTSLAIGVPLNLTGKKRVEMINSIRGTTFNNININLQPCAQYNLMTQRYQPAVSVKVNF